MRRQIASFALMVCGIIALVGGLTMLPSATTASAQAPEPSPRPALQPTLQTGGNKPTAVIPGRLTGTIIDMRTGAPMPGVAVAIGDQIIYSDSNGNYDIWLTSGYYQLELKPTDAQGKPIQPVQQVAVGPGDTVVVHLFFTSPAPTAIVDATSAAPQAATPTPTVAPAVALPRHMPDTSVAHTSVTHPMAEITSAPKGLPVTAAPAGLSSPGTWLICGALMLGLGALIQIAPRRRRRQRATSDEDLLSDLLSRDL
ncbi:MAG: hypothetical protein WCI67_02010 [Chloroflexales bacterium]